MTAFDDAYKQYTVDTEDACPVNPDRLAAVEDNTELMYLHDPSLLRNVEQRYNQHDIYTYTAFILIAVNPYAAPARPTYSRCCGASGCCLSGESRMPHPRPIIRPRPLVPVSAWPVPSPSHRPRHVAALVPAASLTDVLVLCPFTFSFSLSFSLLPAGTKSWASTLTRTLKSTPSPRSVACRRTCTPWPTAPTTRCERCRRTSRSLSAGSPAQAKRKAASTSCGSWPQWGVQVRAALARAATRTQR